MDFESILFPRGDAPPDLPETVPTPDCFPDLNLDLVVASATAGRDEYNLRPFYHSPRRTSKRSIIATR